MTDPIFRSMREQMKPNGELLGRLHERLANETAPDGENTLGSAAAGANHLPPKRARRPRRAASRRARPGGRALGWWPPPVPPG
ncbi:MAG: hypothetical protein LBG11_02665 [Bifidobacteriaceae bacterium]|jgi:hypothetical protein|nr:hypothetical protein [Bifidobacteriaceae bacterium]